MSELRDQQIIEFYMGGETTQWIADQLSLSYPTVLNVVKKAGVWNHPDRKPVKKSERSFGSRDVISPAHRVLGVRLGYYRMEAELEQGEVSRLSGIAVKRLSACELGQADLTLSEMLKLGEVLGFDITELVKGMECQ